jgi:DNA-binding transcriptional ArsR family regulator
MTRIMGIVNLSHPLDLLAHGIDGRILEVLCGADAAFTGRQVHALVGSGSASGVQLSLDRLRRQGIVTAEPAGRAILYRLNTSHLAAAHLQALVNLRRELLGRLRSDFEGWNPRPLAAYVFGSTARRDSTADSDIDLCLMRPLDVDADAPAWRNQVDRLSRMVMAWTGNEARVVEFSEDEVRSTAGHDTLLASIRTEGIQLAGDESLLRPNRPER